MYYSHPCTYCGKIFYTYDNSKEFAARTLFHGIKKHLHAYNEDHKEYEMDESPEIEEDQMYKSMKESEERPIGGNEL